MNAPLRAGRWSPAADWIAALAVVALWLVTRAYRGVRHDAVLYLGQTLERLMPGRYGHDLFFAYGSQDRYSQFSTVTAPLVAHFGVGPTELVGLLACNAFFVFACWKLTEAWPSRATRWAALMFVAVLPHTYGGLGQFSFAEPFLTARSVAEPFALLALWQVLRGRVALGLGFAAFGAAFHPLVVLPALVVGAIYLALQDRRWAWLGLAVLVPAALGAAGLAPFDAVWQRFDPAWSATIREHTPTAFIASYALLDWAPVAFDALVLGLFMRCASPQLAAFAKATLIGVASLTAAWALGADVLQDVLLTQLQLWRGLWLMHLFALLALPCVVAGYWPRGWVGKWCAAALALAGIAVMSNWATGYVCVAWACVALAAEHWKAEVSRVIAIGAVAGSCFTIVAISVKVARTTMDAVSHAPDRFDNAGWGLVVLGLPVCGTLLAALLLWLLAQGGRARAGALLIAGAIAVFGAAMWDQRSDWQRRVEAGLEAGPPAFDGIVPPEADVYWEGDVLAPWMLGRRAEFYNFAQAAGVMFNRGTAQEYVRRERVMSRVEAQRQVCETIDEVEAAKGLPPQNCMSMAQVLAETCRATPHPDYFVFDSPLTIPPLADWRYLSPRGHRQDKSYFLYRCPGAQS